MKKFIALSIVLGVLVGGVFAQTLVIKDGTELTINVWGRAMFAPLWVEVPDVGDTQAYAGTVAPWVNDNNPRVARLQFAGSSKGSIGSIGFRAWIQSDFGNDPMMGWGDYADVWAKLWGDRILLDMGKFKYDALRGKVGTDTAANGTVGIVNNADSVFTRFQSNNLAGFLLALTPIEGLTIGATVNGGNFWTWADDVRDRSSAFAEDAYEAIQVGVGYQIGTIGLVRAQYVGSAADIEIKTTTTSPSETTYSTAANKRIEAAFAFTGVEGLVVDLGIKIPFGVKEDYSNRDLVYRDPFKVAVSGQYKTGSFGILGLIEAAFAGSYKWGDYNVANASHDYDAKYDEYAYTGFNLYLNPTFGLGSGGLLVGADLNLKIKASDYNYKANETRGALDTLGIGLYLQQALGTGYIRGGLSAMIPTDWNNKTFTFGIPILLEYWF
jgi:hypothetical protein